MDCTEARRGESARQDVTNLLLHLAVKVSHTADLLGQLARGAPATAEPAAMADVQQGVALLSQARQRLIASADTLIGRPR